MKNSELTIHLELLQVKRLRERRRRRESLQYECVANHFAPRFCLLLTLQWRFTEFSLECGPKVWGDGRKVTKCFLSCVRGRSTESQVRASQTMMCGICYSVMSLFSPPFTPSLISSYLLSSSQWTAWSRYSSGSFFIFQPRPSPTVLRSLNSLC